MKKLTGFLVFIAFLSSCVAQTKIHSHNDYQQLRPLFAAYEFRADQIEADVFLVDDSLVVAHSKKQINPDRTLTKLYLAPISVFFKKHGGSVSDDKKYTFNLLIDVKENWNLVYPVLEKEIEKYGSIFDKSRNKMAVRIIISGARPVDSTFHTYPKWLYFDGLPNISYAKKDFERVTMISGNFANYSNWKGVGKIPMADKEKLKLAVEIANNKYRAFRFWGAPDTEECWKLLTSLGNVIINTDKVAESKLALNKK